MNFILKIKIRIPPNAECADGQEFKQNDIKRLFDGGFSIKHFQYNYTHDGSDGSICVELRCKLGYDGDPQWNVQVTVSQTFDRHLNFSYPSGLEIMLQGFIDDDRFKSMNRYNDLEVNSISIALGYNVIDYVIDEQNEVKDIFQYLGEPCTNIDECALNTHNCTIDRSTCQDTEGSYFCPCKLGWVSDIKQGGFQNFDFQNR